jgi:hypothetical protein
MGVERRRKHGSWGYRFRYLGEDLQKIRMGVAPGGEGREKAGAN